MLYKNKKLMYYLQWQGKNISSTISLSAKEQVEKNPLARVFMQYIGSRIKNFIFLLKCSTSNVIIINIVGDLDPDPCPYLLKFSIYIVKKKVHKSLRKFYTTYSRMKTPLTLSILPNYIPKSKVLRLFFFLRTPDEYFTR